MSKLHTLSVLLVEDDLIFQEAFRRVFSEIKGVWQIHAVQDGASALEVLTKTREPFALALIDIGLPDISGIDVIALVRQRFATLPILVTSVFKSENVFLSAIRAGANGYLLKNETELSLARSIEQVIAGEYPVSPALARHLFKLAGSTTATVTHEQFKLAPREFELLKHIAQGHSYSRCAELMHISLSTVQSHIRNTYRKLEVTNHRQAISKIQSTGALLS